MAKETIEQIQARMQAQQPVGFIIDPAQQGRYPLSDNAVQQTLSDLGHPHLLNDIQALSKNAGLAPPVVFIDYNNPQNPAAAQKAADGRHRINLNNEFLRTNSREKVRGVIGHELAHIKLGHTENVGAPTFGQILMAASPKIAMWVQRQRESAADKQGALIAGGIEGMTDFFRDMMQQRKAASPPGFINRLKNSRPMRRLRNMLREDHPTDEKRIKKLEQFARRHPAELQESKSKLDGLWGKAGKEFSQAAPRSAAPTPKPAAPAPKPAAAARPSMPRMR